MTRNTPYYSIEDFKISIVQMGKKKRQNNPLAAYKSLLLRRKNDSLNLDPSIKEDHSTGRQSNVTTKKLKLSVLPQSLKRISSQKQTILNKPSPSCLQSLQN